MNPLVSVIIPVYNLEGYIENCLKNITNQTYNNLEILCIDDGSIDSSANIIKDFAETDSRIKLVQQKNAGVSAARNKGLNICTGEYVTFLDGDDYLHPQAIEILVNGALKDDIDVVCADFKTTNEYCSDFPKIDNYQIKKIKYEEMFQRIRNHTLWTTCWGKLYKSEVAKSASFPEGFTNGEDAYYVAMIMNLGVSILSIQTEVYYYFIRKNSATNSPFNIKNFSTTILSDILCENLRYTKFPVLRSELLTSLYISILLNRTNAKYTPYEAQVFSESKTIGNKWLKLFLLDKNIDLITKIKYFVFFKFHKIYELVRIIIDPTMKDFYRSRKNNSK